MSTPPTASPSPQARRGVARFVAAVSVSFYGDWLTTVGMVVLLFQLTGSGVASAGYILVRVAPRLGGPSLGGALADRFRPTVVVATCWLTQGALTLLIIFFADRGSLVGIYVCVGLAQFLNAMARPGHGAIMPRLVRAEQLGRINAAYAVADSTSMFIAPGLGSLILAASGVRALLVIDAATFVVGAALLLSILLPADEPNAGPRRKTSRAEGAVVVWRDPVLRTVAVNFFCGALVVTTAQAVLVVAAVERFGGADSVGFLYSVVGLGSVLGSLVVLRFRPMRVGITMLTLAGSAEVLTVAGFGLLSWQAGAAALLGASAVSGVLGETWGSIDLQARTTADLLGRVNAAIFTALYTGMLLGALVALVLAPLVHWDHALLIAVACAETLIVVTALTGRSHAAPKPGAG